MTELESTLTSAIGLDNFPDDALLRVFHFVSLSDRIRLETVNKRWRNLLLKSWADVGPLIIWHDGIYEEISADNEVDPVYVANADVTAIENILKKASINLKSLKFVDTAYMDERIVSAITQYCRNLEELELHKVLFPEELAEESVRVVENLLTLPRLSAVAWNQNMVYDDSRQLNQNRRTRGGVHVALFPPLSGADSFTVMRGLRKLHLEDASILWANFVFVCIQLAPTLEEFCYKIWDQFLVPLRYTMMRGLQNLTNLKQLNIGGDRNILRPLGGLVDDEFAQSITIFMPRMERLSVKASERLGTKGVTALIQNLRYLKYLNLNQCDSVNNSSLEAACEMRPKNNETFLTIYAADTEIDLEKLNIKNDDVNVLTNPTYIDESVFYGEQRLAE